MNLNLAIDQGNSSSKVYVFDGEKLVDRIKFYKQLTIDDLQSVFDSYAIGSAIFSSVQNGNEDVKRWLDSKTETFLELTSFTRIPMNIVYDTPASLGHDRIAGGVGAICQCPNSNLLVIDAGTAVTLDVIDEAGNFLGGNISPGLTTRFQSLNNFTHRLPLVNKNGEIPLIGHDTVTAMRAGVVLGLVSEIEGYISRVSEKMKDLKVIITGGDCHFLAKRIKMPIMEDENLLANGLNRILLYNK